MVDKISKRKRTLTWSEGLLVLIIILSTFSLLTIFIFYATFHPDVDAQNSLARLADNYYIEYLYPRFVGSKMDQPETVLAIYSEKGIPSVRLRQLLSYNDTASQEEKYFANAYYECNKNTTSVRYFPTAPYGPRDYRVEYNYACEFL